MRNPDAAALRALALRPATTEDELFLRHLFATTRAAELALMSWGEQQKEAFVAMQFSAQSRQYAMSYPNAEHRIIVWGEAPIGRLLVDKGEPEFTLVDIALLADYQNLGIGTRLIKDLLREAAAAGKPVRLHVLTSSAAKRLYERLGFSRVGGDAVYLEMKWVPSVLDPAE
jgi:ribosomal protein S18 acetylase RimI-like enzyme